MTKGMLIIRNVGKRHRIFLILNCSAKDKVHHLFAINIAVAIVFCFEREAGRQNGTVEIMSRLRLTRNTAR
ncbi:hypothetical protein AWP63_26070 [Escherichia coli]|nr:hypothetical protein AWP63_26070 [Escherichia coli]